ncbi:trafficking protein particle complex subunit 10-like [Erethizon dorsatum]
MVVFQCRYFPAARQQVEPAPPPTPDQALRAGAGEVGTGRGRRARAGRRRAPRAGAPHHVPPRARGSFRGARPRHPPGAPQSGLRPFQPRPFPARRRRREGPPLSAARPGSGHAAAPGPEVDAAGGGGRRGRRPARGCLRAGGATQARARLARRGLGCPWGAGGRTGDAGSPWTPRRSRCRRWSTPWRTSPSSPVSAGGEGARLGPVQSPPRSQRPALSTRAPGLRFPEALLSRGRFGCGGTATPPVMGPDEELGLRRVLCSTGGPAQPVQLRAAACSPCYPRHLVQSCGGRPDAPGRGAEAARAQGAFQQPGRQVPRACRRRGSPAASGRAPGSPEKPGSRSGTCPSAGHAVDRRTGAGEQNLFTSIYPTLSQQLPREPMEWRRSYGRAPKMIHLESNFVQFKEELLPKEGNKALLTFPFLHIYWTECCDTEVYKATVKDDLTKWQNVLKAHSSVDWLIVVVENGAKKKNKTNILPRTSIVDKIRNDFCNKQSDRCVVLSDPLKDSSRTQESWNAFLTKLRTLLLMSFTKNLGKFEDDMRTLREKRTEPGWSFCDYFMVQEELAFVFEMLQQFEDALVQYDELDALFSQYVVNFGAGDGANWLTFFCQPVKSWNGLVLRKPIDMEKRELIQRREATLLDLRSYLFSRQCTLLLFLQRPWEVAQRALELLHSCVQELRLLEINYRSSVLRNGHSPSFLQLDMVSVPLGALDCWVFLSCLEVLQRIEGCCDRAQIDSNIAHTVGLWSYATEKVPAALPSAHVILTGAHVTANTAQSPYKKLKEALSSVEAFEKHYLVSVVSPVLWPGAQLRL